MPTRPTQRPTSPTTPTRAAAPAALGAPQGVAKAAERARALLDRLRSQPRVAAGQDLDKVKAELSAISLPASHPLAPALARARSRLLLPAFLADGQAFLAHVAQRPGMEKSLKARHYAAKTEGPESLDLNAASLLEVRFATNGPTKVLYRVRVSSTRAGSGLNSEVVIVTVLWDGGTSPNMRSTVWDGRWATLANC